MGQKIINKFTDSSGALLLAVGLALILANLSSIHLQQPHDPILMLSMNSGLWIAGTLALGVAIICLFGKALWLKLGMLLWVGTSLLVYQCGFYSQTHHLDMRGYLGAVARAFALPANAGDWMLRSLSAYLFLGSFICLLSFWNESKSRLKLSCAHCGQHIQFALRNLGQTIPCPHCQTVIALRKADESLKMSCFFCKENISFPAHAIGHKISCPHCNKDVRLKEEIA